MVEWKNDLLHCEDLLLTFEYKLRHLWKRVVMRSCEFLVRSISTQTELKIAQLMFLSLM